MNDDEHTKRIEHQLRRGQYKRPQVAGYRMTFHAVARTIVRKIDAQWIINAIRSENYTTTGETTRKYYGDLAAVTVNKFTKEIITVGYGTRNNPHSLALLVS